MLKQYRALIWTIVKDASTTVKFNELIYTTDQEHEQKLLDKAEGVICLTKCKAQDIIPERPEHIKSNKSKKNK